MPKTKRRKGVRVSADEEQIQMLYTQPDLKGFYTVPFGTGGSIIKVIQKSEFRRLVDLQRPAYLALDDEKKRLSRKEKQGAKQRIANGIIEHIHRLPGKFVEWNGKKWIEVADHDKVYRKTTQSLRQHCSWAQPHRKQKPTDSKADEDKDLIQSSPHATSGAPVMYRFIEKTPGTTASQRQHGKLKCNPSQQLQDNKYIRQQFCQYLIWKQLQRGTPSGNAPNALEKPVPSNHNHGLAPVKIVTTVNLATDPSKMMINRVTPPPSTECNPTLPHCHHEKNATIAGSRRIVKAPNDPLSPHKNFAMATSTANHSVSISGESQLKPEAPSSEVSEGDDMSLGSADWGLTLDTWEGEDCSTACFEVSSDIMG